MKILVMELAGLGDNVHLLPALWLVRQHWKDAELHVMVNAHVASLFRLTTWIDRVWAYPSSPKPGLLENLHWARTLRAEAFDRVINTTGSDRSSMLTWVTRAPHRMGRRPADGGPIGWRHLFTQVVDYPHYEAPMYRQKWEALRLAGIGPADARPEFHVTIDPEHRRRAGIALEDEGRYFHVSPFTTADERELPSAQMAGLLGELRARHPELRLVLSCAATARERARMQALLKLLPELPWRVLAGTLDVAMLAAIMEKSRVNLSGDTGTLHLAMMSGVPAVAWFRRHRGVKEWTPEGSQYRVLIGEGGARDALHGISSADVLDAVDEVLAARRSPP